MAAQSQFAAPGDRADATREALVRVALDRFGAKGFEATSTREIANAAKVNLAAIGYHFGGKEGLRKACAEHVAAVIGRTLGPVLRNVGPFKPLAPEEAEAAISRALAAGIDFVVVSAEAEPIVRFVLRELTEPSSTFDIIHDSAMRPAHERICILWARATGGDPESEATRLATLAMLGQVLYFRIARRVVLRRMDWRGIARHEAAAIKSVILRNLDGAIEAARRAPS
jgi:AcrR family transcriptional regulator